MIGEGQIHTRKRKVFQQGKDVGFIEKCIEFDTRYMLWKVDNIII